MEDFSDLQRLLSLKRHETPAEDFFEDFMRDFHRAQRAELLKRSVWRIALDRLEGLWPALPAGRYAYAGSCATALAVAAFVSGRILDSPVSIAAARPVTAAERLAGSPRMDFYASRPALGLAELNFDKPPRGTAASSVSRPRYVLDSRPVSYEQPLGF